MKCKQNKGIMPVRDGDTLSAYVKLLAFGAHMIKLMEDFCRVFCHILFMCVYACTHVRCGSNMYLSLLQVSTGGPGPWSREKYCFSGEHTNLTHTKPNNGRYR